MTIKLECCYANTPQHDIDVALAQAAYKQLIKENRAIHAKHDVSRKEIHGGLITMAKNICKDLSLTPFRTMTDSQRKTIIACIKNPALVARIQEVNAGNVNQYAPKDLPKRPPMRIVPKDD